ncbi:hypothetical protein B566_EDAN017276 [Ephemera danica]|nr:hypothetical protein B566_EDAN017276 [Ephemera danica]
MDVLVCGTCQQVFHLIFEFHEHKKKSCSKPIERTSSFGIELWAFTLWKSSPKTKNLFPDATNNAVMWRNWKQLAKNKQDTWIAAGSVFYQLALLEKSDAEFDSAEFEKAMENASQPNIKQEATVKAVPLANLKKDPKLTAGPTVTLERVFMPDVSPVLETFDFLSTRNTYGKRAQSSENTQTQSKKSRVEVASSPNNQEESEESQEYVVEAIVGKKYDKSTMTFLYEIKWEGFPSSQNTWEPEANLTHCKDMIADYELKKGSNISATGKPVRSSKARAMDKVKCWVGSKDSIEELHSEVEIKIEEKDPLDIDYIAEYDDGVENSYNPSESEEDQPLSKMTQITKTPQKQAAKTKPPVKSNAKKPVSNAKTPVSNAKTPVFNAKSPVSNAKTPVSNAKTLVSSVNIPYNIPSNMDPKTTTLLVANSLGMVRVNAKALPNVKSGIYNIDSNEQLQRIKPLIPKLPVQTKSGLVVITSDANLEKPGIRRKPLVPLSSKNAQSKTLSTLPQQPTTTFVMPPNPGNTPFLLVAPPGSGIGGLLFTPEIATATPKNVQPTITMGVVPPAKKETAPKNSSSMIVKAAFAKALQNEELKSVDKSASDSTELSTSEISLSMEVTQHDSDGEETINFTLDEGSGELKKKGTKQDSDKVIEGTELKEGKKIDENAKQQSNSQEKESEKPNETEIPNKLLNESKGSDCPTETENAVKNQVESELEKLHDSNTKPSDEKMIDSMVESAFSPGQMDDIDKALETAISGTPNSLKDDESSSSKSKADSEEKVTEDTSSSGDQDFALAGPQLVSIPPGIDPTLIELPPNTQLMVADSGEYYLVPLQPEGKNDVDVPVGASKKLL